MKATDQRQLDASHRSLDYLGTHENVVGAIGTSLGRSELETATANVENFSLAQGSAALSVVGGNNTIKALTAALRFEHMVPIATFARARLRGAPGIAELTVSLSQVKGARLLHAARAMATAAAPYRELFVEGGMPSDTIAQLGAAVMALESAIRSRANAKVERRAATKGIAENLRNSREALNILHAVITKHFAADKTFLAGWNSAKRVAKKSGATRGAGKGETATPLSLATNSATAASPLVPEVASA